MTAIQSSTSRWIVCRQPRSQARARLFCLPWAGTGASQFYAWSSLLPADVELCAIQLPGRENRLAEPPYTRLADLVAVLAEELRRSLDRPFALFGHSMGAWIAFELARQLRRQYHLLPAHLFVAGRRAPQVPSPDPPIHRLPEPQFVEELRRRYDGLPDAILQDAEVLRIFLPILRADLAMVETFAYTAEPRLDCPISAYGGTDDPWSSPAGLAGWREQTTGAFSLRLFSGGHFFVQTARAPLIADISAALGRSGLA